MMKLLSRDRLDWVLDTARHWLEEGQGLDLTVLCGHQKTRLRCHKLMLHQFLERNSGQGVFPEADLLLLPEYDLEEFQDYLAFLYGYGDQSKQEPSNEDVNAKNEIDFDDRGNDGRDKVEIKVENVPREEETPSSKEQVDKDLIEEIDANKLQEGEIHANRKTVERHHGMIKHCVVCSEEFDSSGKAKAHMLAFHSEELQLRKLTCKDKGTIRLKMYQCDEESCEKLFMRLKSKERHMMNNHGITCPVCGKTLSSRRDLTKHLETSHPETVKHQEELCPECGDTLQNRTKFLFHMLYQHKKDMFNKDYKYFCKICNFKSRSQTCLKEHNMIHTGEKPEVCSFCGKSFRAKKTLQNHERLHSKIKPNVCQYCDQRFVQKTSLKSHIKVHHKDKSI